MTSSSFLSRLYSDLSKVVSAKSDNFCKLASAAGLDPAEDFVGADLSGVDLAGLDLRNFDFRGADFSGANLIGTRFDPAKIAGAKFDKPSATKEPAREIKRAQEKLTLLRNHPLFRDLPATVIEHLGSYIKTRKISRGTTVFAKGDPGTSLLGVLDGSVKIRVESAEGRDIVLNIFQKGDIFGEIALLDGRPRAADAIAMSDCELIVIERRDFVPFLGAHPDVTIKFIEILCSRLRSLNEKVQDLTFADLPVRLAKALLALARGTETSAPKLRVPISQRDISQVVGRSRESTNKQLRAWAGRGWLQLERGHVSILKPDELANIAEASEFDPS